MVTVGADMVDPDTNSFEKVSFLDKKSMFQQKPGGKIDRSGELSPKTGSRLFFGSTNIPIWYFLTRLAGTTSPFLIGNTSTQSCEFTGVYKWSKWLGSSPIYKP